ncbi:MAG: hypothetical protein R3F19_34390 [Verrucomicrobiales bacterium]
MARRYVWQRFFQSVGLSDVLHLDHTLSLSAFITIFVPIRVGPIMGPRVGRYFDQIVLSGISPLRYFSGKVLSQNVFLAVIAMAAMPYLVLCVSLGGISAKYALLGVFVRDCLRKYTGAIPHCCSPSLPVKLPASRSLSWDFLWHSCQA